MTDLGSIAASIRLNISDFTTNMRLVEDTLEDTEQRISGITKIGDRFTATGKQLSMGVTLPLIGLGTACTKFFNDFETGMAKISTVADTTAVPIEKLGDQVKELSNSSGLATSDLSAGLYDVLSAGVKTEDSISYLTVAVKAAKGGFTDTATAVDGLTSVLNAYGLEGAKANDIANQMMVAQNLGKTTFGEMSQVMGNVTPIANALKVKTDELFSSFAVLTANGIKTAEASTGLKAAFSNMIKPTKEAKDAAEAMGLQFDANTISAKGWMPTLQDIQKKVSEAAPEYAKMAEHQANVGVQMGILEKANKTGTEEYKKLNLEYNKSADSLKALAGASKGTLSGFATMFGSVEGLNSILTLTSQQGMSLYTESMNQMGDGTDRIESAFNKMSDTAENNLTKSLNSLKNSGIALGAAIAPMVAQIAGLVANLAEKLNAMTPGQTKVLVGFLAIAAAVGPLIMIFGKLITSTGAIIGLFSNMSNAVLLSGGVIPAITALGTAIWTAMAPLLPFIAAIAAVVLIVGTVTSRHAKQAEEVKKTEEAYKKFNETLKGGSTKELQDYEKQLQVHQAKLEELTKAMNDAKDVNNMLYSSARRELDQYIETVRKQGFTYDEATGKIVELAKVQNRINTQEELDRIRLTIETRAQENQGTIDLINRYTELSAKKKRTEAEDIELSNTAKELNNKYSDLKISIDDNGKAIITNIGLLGKKKTALEIDTQNIKENAYQEAKSAIYSEQVEIGKTKLTIGEIEKRIKARDAESKASMIGLERQTPQAQAESMAYLDAYVRLKNIKAEISAINIPSAPSGSSSYTAPGSIDHYTSTNGSDTSGTNIKQTYEVGVEATTKYSKTLVDVSQNLEKVDDKINGIQKRIETSKAIGTAEELAKVTEEQNELYKAQAEKITALQGADKTLNDSKQRLIAEFKSNYSSLKNVDISKWQEDDFNAFIEKTYKQSTTTDKVRADALKKGEKYAQDSVRDLVAILNKTSEVEDGLTNVKIAQIKTLQDIDNSAKESTANIVKFANEIVDALKAQYAEDEKLQNESINNKIKANEELKQTTLKDLDTVYNAKVAAIDKEAKLHDIANKDSEEATKESELRKILTLNYSKKRKEEAQKELDKLLADNAERKYQEDVDNKKEKLKTDLDTDKINAEALAKKNDDFYKGELERVKNFYIDKNTQASLDADAQKLIIGNNQNDIVKLLKTYSTDYATVGATLGERLVASFKDKLSGITDTIQEVFKNINSSIQLPSIPTSSSLTPSLPSVGAGTYNSSTVNSITYGSLLSTDKVEINNGMSIEQLATELAFYMKQKTGGKG